MAKHTDVRRPKRMGSKVGATPTLDKFADTCQRFEQLAGRHALSESWVAHSLPPARRPSATLKGPKVAAPPDRECPHA